MTTPRKQTGNQGEKHACAYLERHGYDIMQTNWRCKSGEIDIIAQHDNTLVFVEVKTRRGKYGTDAVFAQITPAKRRKLIKSANLYLSENQPHNRTWRIDAIAIAISAEQPPIITIDHVEDALDW